MSPATTANPAWLTVPSAEGLPDQVEAEIGPVAERIGFVPNVARLLAFSPDHFTGWWRYFDALMRGPSGLSKTQREMIAVVVPAEAAEGGIDMKKMIIGAAVVAAALGAIRRFAPAIHERVMNKCHQMMGKCQEMLSKQAGSPAGVGCMTAATPGPEQTAADRQEPAEATQAT